MKARVGMVVHHYFPRDVRVRREARALRAVGCDVCVYALRAPGEQEQDEWQGISIRRLPVRRHRGSSLPVYLGEYLSFAALAFSAVTAAHLKKRFDVVHVHAPPDFLVWAAAAVRLAGARTILDIHDLTPELYGSRFKGKGGRSMIRMLEQAEINSCRIADRVITVTDVFGEALLSRGVPKHKLAIIHNYPDPELFRRPTRPARSGKGRTFRMLHHGTLMKRYGADVLLDAFELIAGKLPHARLDVYGEGDALEDMKKRILKAPLKGRVRLHGDVRQEALVSALARADLCLVPNRKDSFTDLLLPTKLLEALHMGCPVVSSATSLLVDTFTDGSVQFVPPGDVEALAQAVVDLANDPGKRRRLSLLAREQAKRFSWAVEKKKLIALYQSLLPGSR